MLFRREDKVGYLDTPANLDRCLCITYNDTQFYYTDDTDLINVLILDGYRPVNTKLFNELITKLKGGE